MVLIGLPCTAFSTFFTYFVLQGRTVPKVKALLLAVVYSVIILIMMMMPLSPRLPEIVLRFIMYSIEFFSLVGLLTVTGERNLKNTMCYTLFSYLFWYLLHMSVIGITYFLIGRWVRTVYILCGGNVASCILLIWVVRMAVSKYDLCGIVRHLEDRVNTWSKVAILYLGFIIAASIMDIMTSLAESVNVAKILFHPLALVGLLAFLRSISGKITMKDRQETICAGWAKRTIAKRIILIGLLLSLAVSTAFCGEDERLAERSIDGVAAYLGYMDGEKITDLDEYEDMRGALAGKYFRDGKVSIYQFDPDSAEYKYWENHEDAVGGFVFIYDWEVYEEKTEFEIVQQSEVIRNIEFETE